MFQHGRRLHHKFVKLLAHLLGHVFFSLLELHIGRNVIGGAESAPGRDIHEPATHARSDFLLRCPQVDHRRYFFVLQPEPLVHHLCVLDALWEAQQDEALPRVGLGRPGLHDLQQQVLPVLDPQLRLELRSAGPAEVLPEDGRRGLDPRPTRHALREARRAPPELARLCAGAFRPRPVVVLHRRAEDVGRNDLGPAELVRDEVRVRVLTYIATTFAAIQNPTFLEANSEKRLRTEDASKFTTGEKWKNALLKVVPSLSLLADAGQPDQNEDRPRRLALVVGLRAIQGVDDERAGRKQQHGQDEAHPLAIATRKKKSRLNFADARNESLGPKHVGAENDR